MIWLSMFIEVYRCEDGTGCHQWPTGNLRDIFMIFQDKCLVAARFWLIFVGTLLTNEGFSFSCLITGRFVKFEFIFPILGRKIPVLFFEPTLVASFEDPKSHWWFIGETSEMIHGSGGGRRREGNVHMDSLVPGTTLSMNLSLDGCHGWLLDPLNESISEWIMISMADFNNGYPLVI